MKLIDKDALVAEIERRKHKLLDNIICESDKEWVVRTVHQLNRIILFLDTIEVKEVDLELNSFDATVCKICNTYLKEMDKDAIVKALESYKDGDKVKVIIKAQKGE